MGTSTRTFTFWRDHNDLVKPITKDCNIVTIPFRSNLGPEIITKVMNTDKFEILGIEEDGTWTMSIIAREIDKPIYTKKDE
jgi:pyrimidine operon attenuation protein/uracil phosphoribosyltransferase